MVDYIVGLVGQSVRQQTSAGDGMRNLYMFCKRKNLISTYAQLNNTADDRRIPAGLKTNQLLACIQT